MPRAADATRCFDRLRRAARRVAALGASAALLAVAVPAADVRAQGDDVPPPPRIDRAAEAARAPAAGRRPATATATQEPRGDLLFELKPQDLAAADAEPLPSALNTFVRPPNAARLAPLPTARAAPSGVEEIIVLGGNWRLPDLGSRWRARQEAAEESGEPHLTLLPLYDPERPTTFNNTFLLNREVERIGYIDLFRVRFGKRAKPDDE